MIHLYSKPGDDVVFIQTQEGFSKNKPAMRLSIDQVINYDTTREMISEARLSSNFELKMLDEKVDNFKCFVNLDEENPLSARVVKSIQKDKQQKYSTRGNLIIIPSRDRHARIKNTHIKNNKNFWSSGFERTNISKIPEMKNQKFLEHKIKGKQIE